MRITNPNEIAMLEMANAKSDKGYVQTTITASFQKVTLAAEGEEGMTRAKWLALIALGIGYTTAFQQGACIGAIVKSIDEALGPTTYYNWMLSASTITSTISLPLAGGLSDIFGRRVFIIAGGFISLLAAVIALAAGNVPTMIASAAVAGLGSGSQQLALAAVSELVPNKMRGRVQACLDLLILPWSVFGALTGGAMVVYHGKHGFRINFIIGVILNAVSIGAAWIWYHPPSQGAKLGNRTKMQAFKDLDWTGVGLMNTGIILMLVAIGIGGTTVPWTTPGLLALVAVSIMSLLSFWLWEAKFAKNPFMARELFAGKARTFTAFLLIDFVAGMGLYAAAAFWAQLVRGLWQGDPIKVGILCIPGGIGGAIGGFAAGMLIGKGKLFKTQYCLIYGTLIKTIADFLITLIQPTGPYSIPFGMGIGFLSMLGTGWITVALIVCVQLSCSDENLGLATLLLGAVRAIGGSVAVTIYTSLLNNTLTKQAGPTIGKAVVPLGYPESGLRKLIFELTNENIEAAAGLPGVTPDILAAARQGLRETWTVGFHRVYFCAASFAAVAFVVALFTRDVSGNMTGHVAVRLENERPAAGDVESKR
ncbi:hypothetical protein FKW77_004056 [Venturia effusa]|uniref:Major facilitator superfamily (MFS) profile domain-containing protein n=1 Tax=Venturia effusa TaxID=50376 RepID=A0A517LGY9_9PEZI|nr:hypothetical protein FKW77_004056 [Venturia effusa]